MNYDRQTLHLMLKPSYIPADHALMTKVSINSIHLESLRTHRTADYSWALPSNGVSHATTLYLGSM